MSERTYIGKGRQKAGSEYVVLHLDANALQNAPTLGHDAHARIKVIMARMRKPDLYGNTHTLYLPAEERGYNERLIDEQELEARE